MSNNTSNLKGGTFILGDSNPDEIFITEEFTEEQRMIADMVHDFMEQEIHHKFMERGRELQVTNEEDKAEVLALLKKAGEMGFCGVGIPEEYGGTDLDFRSGTLFSAETALGFSFATTLGAQISIGSLPIVYYGNEEQRQRYLPGIATGELIAAYALTEPNAGSDANSGKTRAKLNADGTHYILNGQKIWITNGGFADVYIVFAKIDDDEDLSAFIVERKYDGFTTGKEEKKMGIKGSSTVQLFFEDCPVPVENLLGERGSGFKMALNILNGGRLKAGAGGMRGGQFALDIAVKYAKERKQFDTPIANFGAIQYKIGDLATNAFAGEAAVYRIAGLLDKKYEEGVKSGMPSNEAKLNATREYAVETSIVKVYGTELGCHTIDEAIQIHGGMGYAVETGLEMAYRDGRITRIYEGTNEINRMLAVGELTKRGVITKEIDLLGAGKKVPGYMISQMLPFKSSSDRAEEMRVVRSLKNTFLLVSGIAGKKLGKKLIDEQEMVMNFADLLTEAFIADSVLMKMKKLRKMGTEEKEQMEVQEAMLKLFLYESCERARRAAHEAIDSFATGTQRWWLRKAVNAMLRPVKTNPKELRRKVAQYVIKKDGYSF